MDIPAEFSWLTELQVRVAVGPYPNQAPEEVYFFTVGDPDLGGEPWHDDLFVSELEALTWPGRGKYQLPYELAVRKGHSSWGADGATAAILLYIANHAASGGIGAVTGAAIMRTLGRLRDRVRPEGDDRLVQTPQELAEYGRWAVSAAFADWLPDDSGIEMVGEARTAKTWTGTFRDASGNTYEVTLGVLDGNPHVVHIGRLRG